MWPVLLQMKPHYELTTSWLSYLSLSWWSVAKWFWYNQPPMSGWYKIPKHDINECFVCILWWLRSYRADRFPDGWVLQGLGGGKKKACIWASGWQMPHFIRITQDCSASLDIHTSSCWICVSSCLQFWIIKSKRKSVSAAGYKSLLGGCWVRIPRPLS